MAFVLRSNTSWMNGFYGLPSGKVEKGESFSLAAAREALEEIGIKIKPAKLKFVHVAQRKEGGKASDWVDIFFEAVEYEGEVVNAEPDVHSEVVWFDPANLPEKIIPSLKFAVEQIEAGKMYSEFGW
jgi:8-oxo-dGTP diphosphatase